MSEVILEEGDPGMEHIPVAARDIEAYAGKQLAATTLVRVTNRSEFQLESARLRDVKTAQRNLEAMRTSATQPLNQVLATINAWFRGPKEKLARVEAMLKMALGAFELKEQERIAAEERAARQKAEEERLELERRAEAAAKRGREERAAELREKAATVVPAAPATAPLKSKGLGFGTEWVYEVTDEAAVPREYCCLDHGKIRGVVHAMKGATNIPGIKVMSRPRVSAQGNRR